MSVADADPITGVNEECVHVVCAGWATCRYVPEPIGPELPPLILDAEGRFWGMRGVGHQHWWYGDKMVHWDQLRRIRDGLEQRPDTCLDQTAFPWSTWVGCDYAESGEVERRHLEAAAS